MPTDIAGTLAGLDAFAERVNDATRRTVAGAADIYKLHAALNAPVGDPENSTNPPGDLAASMIATEPVGGGGTWASDVGPTVETVHPGPGGTVFNYGRQREFGGLLWAKSSIYLTFKSFGMWHQRLFVYQEGSYYLTRAREEGSDEIDALITAELTAAVNGA